MHDLLGDSSGEMKRKLKTDRIGEPGCQGPAFGQRTYDDLRPLAYILKKSPVKLGVSSYYCVQYSFLILLSRESPGIEFIRYNVSILDNVCYGEGQEWAWRWSIGWVVWENEEKCGKQRELKNFEAKDMHLRAEIMIMQL